MSSKKRKLTVAECDQILTAPGSVLEMEERTLNGRRVRTWKNCPRTFRSFLLGSLTTYSGRIFLSSPTADGGRESLSYHDILDRSLRLAVIMRRHGVGLGSRIAIGGGNSAGWIIAFTAVHLIGGVVVALNAWLPNDVLVDCLRITKPEMVLIDAERATALGPYTEDLKQNGVGSIFCWDETSSTPSSSKLRIPTLGSLVDASLKEIRILREGAGMEDLGPESDAVIFFSSGTNGPPKAVLSTQRMALTNLWSGLVAPSRAALRAGVPVPPLPQASDPQRTVLLAIPLFHVTGSLSWLMRAFFAGSKIVMLRRWEVREAVGLVQTEGVTVIGGVPAVVSSILQSPDLAPKQTFDTVFYGGAPPSKELAKEVKTRWPKAGLVQGYGLTETNAYVCSVAGTDYVERPDSTGPPVPVCDIRIVDPSTRISLPTGEVGLLLVKGPQVMKCYVGDEDATKAAVDQDGWLDTGDVGCLDEDGFLYIKDRLKDIIIRGGENIPSADVENALYAHPAVSEAIALGVPDDILGEKVGAIVSLREGYQGRVYEEDLIASVKTRLGRPAWPVIVVIRDGPLPRNVNGKVVKKDLKPDLVREWERRGREDAGRTKSKL